MSRLVSLGCLLSADPNVTDLLQREHPKILMKSDPPPVELGITDILWQIAAKWLEIVQWSQWGAYRKPPSLSNGTIDDPLRPPFPSKWGSKMHPLMICRISNGHISAMGDPTHFMFGSRVWFSGLAYRMALFLVRSNPGWRPATILENQVASRGFPCNSTDFFQ